jgi:hypothetical protein
MKTKYLIVMIMFVFNGVESYSQSISVCPSDTIYFNSNLKYYSVYSWDFGDGDYSINEKPIHVYSQTGTYQASVTAHDACCPDKDTTYQCTIYVDASASCNSTSNDSITITPNPVSDYMNVYYFAGNVNLNSFSLVLKITEVNSGNTIQTIILNSNLNYRLIDVSSLSTGYYNVSMLVNTTEVAQKLIYKD